jgi:hypothetical protein
VSTLTAIIVLGTVLHVAVLAIMIWIRVQRRTDGGSAETANGTFTPCAVCGKPSAGFRYDGLDPHEHIDPSSGRAWSDDLTHYRPLCAEHSLLCAER